MRIEHIHVDAFGKLEGFESGPRPLGPLVVVLGPNEAGKSTLFSFLTTALYGFHPASRERNPHVPWGAEEAGGRVSVRLDAQQPWSHEPDRRSADLFPEELELGLDLGPCVGVERRLRTSPSARLARGDVVEELRNQPLPWVEHVPRAVFRQVFAITLADLAGLDEETWGRIQDRVLGSMGASDLRSARDVCEALGQEAGEIWRPNRRGNQRLRDLQEEIRGLRAGRNEALERDRTIRALVEEHEEVGQTLEEVRSQRQRDKIVVERVQELLPVKKQLDRVVALRAEGGPRDRLEGLPEDPRAEAERLRVEADRLREQVGELDRDLVEPSATVERFDDAARCLVGRRDRIDAFLADVSATAGDRARLDTSRRHLEGLALRVRTAAEQILDRPCEGAAADAIAGLSVDLLRDRVERLGELERARRESTVGAGARAPRGGRTAALAIALAGAAALVWGLTGGPLLASIAGAALLAVGLTLAAVRPPEAMTSESAGAERAGSLRREIAEMLRDLPVQSDYVDPPGAPLVSGLDALRRLVVERQEAQAEAEALARGVAAADEAARALAAELGRGGETSAEALGRVLERELREAERARDAASGAARERDRLLRQRGTLVERAEDRERRLEDLLARVHAVAGEAGEAALDAVQRRVEAHARADRIEEELERVHPDLDEVRTRIRATEEDGISWVVDEVDLAERKLRIEDFDARVEELVARAQEIDSRVTHLRQLETVDAVDSAIATLQETEARLVRERDRKWVLAQLVREADRRFREEHQPDLVRRASSYLRRLTGGRYDRLIVDEEGAGDLFRLVGPGLPAPVPLDRPISTATLEQAYLSLRLAIVDHLDQGKERLPLFIDEAFVNWDAERRDRGLEVLAEVSTTRQVFAFTCHPEMARRLEAMGARLVRLER